MQHDQRQLFEIARDYPWYHFTAEQISILCNVGEHKVRLARNAKDTPFRFNLCRPEQLAAWMVAHPEYQDLKSAPVDVEESAEACAESVKQTLRTPSVRAGKKAARKRVPAMMLSKVK
jgi:hypothetical protein